MGLMDVHLATMSTKFEILLKHAWFDDGLKFEGLQLEYGPLFALRSERR